MSCRFCETGDLLESSARNEVYTSHPDALSIVANRQGLLAPRRVLPSRTVSPGLSLRGNASPAIPRGTPWGGVSLTGPSQATLVTSPVYPLRPSLRRAMESPVRLNAEGAAPEIPSTSIGSWENQVVGIMNGIAGAVARGAMPGGGLNPEAQGLYDRLTALRQELIDAQARLQRLREVVTLRTEGVGLVAAVINAWPPAVAAREMILVGAGLFGAGGATYAAVGYPLAAEPRIILPLALWGLGIGILAWGLAKLVSHDNKRWKYFTRTLGFSTD